MTRFYRELYTSEQLKRNDMSTFSGEIGETKTLNVEDKNSCEGRITLEEYEHAVTTLCDNKSPGDDGLTAEFYETFSITFGQFRIQVDDESFQHGELCQSQRKSVLTLICMRGYRKLMKQ